MIDNILDEGVGFMFLDRKMVEKLFQVIGDKKELLDQKTLHFRRKLQPLYEEIEVIIYP